MIEVKQLTKHFGAKKAVDDISFTVKKGEILGFIGPNGAGKSTTMRMITGFIPPTKGSVSIGEHDIGSDSIAARKMMGYLPENAPVYPDMTVNGYLDFIAQIRGFSGAEKKQRVDETIAKCFLTNVTHQTVSTLSKGFKQRVCFAQSILHDPEYLILDEPTDGLDPNQKHEVRLMIQQMSTSKAIIFSTHILDEVEAICSRAIIIADGRIVADDTPENLTKRSPHAGAVSLTIAGIDPEKVLAEFQGLEGIKSVGLIEKNGQSAKIRLFPTAAEVPIADKIMAHSLERRYAVKSIYVEKGRLDEVFREITTG